MTTSTDVVGATPDPWCLRLYVAGASPRSLDAQANLRAFCKEHLDDRCEIEVVDLVEHPERARRDGIVAIPTLIRHLPLPVTKIIGDLSDVDRVLEGLRLHRPAS